MSHVAAGAGDLLQSLLQGRAHAGALQRQVDQHCPQTLNTLNSKNLNLNLTQGSARTLASSHVWHWTQATSSSARWTNTNPKP